MEKNHEHEINFDRYYVPADGNVIAGCIDGRCGCKNHAPNSAGGTLSLWIAARLTDVTEATFAEFLQCFDHHDLPVGGHIDEHSAHNETKTGCGANDRLDEILAVMGATNLDLGAPRERLAALVDAGAEIVTLADDHAEEKVIINRRADTTLDRNLTNGKFFNVDAWAFDSSARATLGALGGQVDNATVEKFVKVLTEFNLATAQVLNPAAEIIERD